MNLINKKYAENLYKKNIPEVYQSPILQLIKFGHGQICLVETLSLVTVKSVW